MAEYRALGALTGPGASFQDGQGISQGTEMYVTDDGLFAVKLWYWRATVAMGETTGSVTGQLYRIDSPVSQVALLGVPAVFPDPVGLGWQSVDIGPVALTAIQRYKPVVHYDDGEYTALNHFWDPGGAGENGLTNGPLVAVNDVDATHGQGTYGYGASIAYPDGSFNAGNYFVDMSVSDGGSPPTRRNSFFH